MSVLRISICSFRYCHGCLNFRALSNRKFHVSKRINSVSNLDSLKQMLAKSAVEKPQAKSQTNSERSKSSKGKSDRDNDLRTKNGKSNQVRSNRDRNTDSKSRYGKEKSNDNIRSDSSRYFSKDENKGFNEKPKVNGKDTETSSRYPKRDNSKPKKYNRKNDNSNRESKQNPTRNLDFLETGNDRDKEAAKRIISIALKSNKKGIVQIIKNGEPIKLSTVIEAYQGVTLKDNGYIVVNTRNIDEENCGEFGVMSGSTVATLKYVDRESVSKQYSEYLAEQANERLRLTNNSILAKQNKKKDDTNSELKIVQVGWNINTSDLFGQKRFEIENHLKKGNDVDIIIDDKDWLVKDNHGFNNSSVEGTEEKLKVYQQRRKQLSEVEKTMRTRVLEGINTLLNELEGLPNGNIGTQKGFFESRIIIRVKGIDNQNKEDKSDKKAKKQQEKALKAEKQRKRREEKERLAKESIKELVL